VADSNDELKRMRRFLTKAAHDDEFRAFLENGSAEDVRAILRDEYGVDIPTIPDVRKIPSPEVCKSLLVWSCWLEEYAEVAMREAAFQAIYMVVGHAMPLVVTAQDAVGATG